MQRDYKHPLTNALAHVIQETVYHVEELRIREFDSQQGLVISVIPHTADHPILVGSAGRQINAYRHLAKRAEGVYLRKIEIKLTESYIGEREPRREFEPNSAFDSDKIRTIITEILMVTLERPLDITIEKDGNRFNAILETEENDLPMRSLVRAIGDVLWPWAFRHGIRLWVKEPFDVNTNETHYSRKDP